MPGQNGTNQSGNNRSGGSEAATDEELVKKVADKVYQMWLRDLKIERERCRPRASRFQRHGGY